MRFEKIYIPEYITKKKNLKAIRLTQKSLGSTVALIGKNGAGKSRILELVSRHMYTITPKDIVEKHIDATRMPTPFKPMFDRVCSKIQNDINSESPNSASDHAAAFLTQQRANLNKYIKIIDTNLIKEIKTGFSHNQQFQSFLSPGATIQNDELNNFNNDNTVSYIKSLTDSIIAKELYLYLGVRGQHENVTSSIQESLKIDESYITFSKFKKHIERFLRIEFDYTHHSNGNLTTSLLTLGGQPFDLKLLSPGQKILFSYAVLFFLIEVSAKTDIEDCIIVIDEPEMHLHPEAQILLIDALKSIIKDRGQLWIATHSVHILSHLQYDEIFMVKDNEIITPSRLTPGQSFNDLMGIEQHIKELNEFTTSISDWAFSNFMKQCFTNPDVIFSTNIKDPQYNKFKDFISKKNDLLVLDFGAGKARFGHTIKEDKQIKGRLTYIPYEPNLQLAADLTIAGFNPITSIKQEIKDNAIDIVIVCNVLHEIHPKKWLQELKQIKRILNDDGYLIVIEDKDLPKGETAHECGYLILREEQLEILFQSKIITELNAKEKENSNNRIVFFPVAKNDINPTPESIVNAITSLRDKSFENIKDCRATKTEDINQGRIYGNQTQLYINSILALEQLSSQ